MKKLILLFLSYFFINCQPKEQPLSITGEVSNYTEDYVIFAQDTTGFGLKTIIDTVELAQDGKFNLVTPARFKSDPIILFDLPQPFRLSFSKFVTEPIVFDLDVSAVDSLTIYGKQAPFIQYHQDQEKYWIHIYEDMAMRHPVLAKSDNQKEEYHKIQDTVTQMRISFLEDYFQGLKMENVDHFIEFEKNSLIYSNLFYRMSGQATEIIKKLSFYQDSSKDDFETLTYSDQVNFSDPALFQIPFYRKFIIDFLMNDVRLNSADDHPSTYEYFLISGIDRINIWFKTPETRSLAQVIFINDLLSNAIIFNAQINVDRFRKRIDELEEDPLAYQYVPVLKDVLSNLENSMAKLSIGKKAPDFNLIDEHDEFFSLSDATDKIIFIDVWASWCAPCISAFPKWNNLVLKNQDNKKTEFLTISVDENPELWEKGLEKYSLKGKNLYAGMGAFKTGFALDYNIKALPHYIAIDNNGRILSVTPSFDEIEQIALKFGTN